MFRPQLANASILALALTGCASVQDVAVAEPQTVAAEPTAARSYPDQASLYSDLDNPMRSEEFQGATILDVDRYRPTYRLTSCAGEHFERAVPTGDLEAAITEVQAYSEEHGGVGLIVLLNGEVIHESYAQGADATTLTASASQMKSVLSLLYGIAIGQGHIGSIDEPVGDYIDEWKGDPRGQITLRQMLTMSTGLGQTDFIQLIFAPDVGAVALGLPLAGEPDTEFYYSNAVSKLLAIALERRVVEAGYASLSQYLHAELWCPMGGSEALVWVDAAGKARGYAGLHATLRDWARVGELIRNKGFANGRQIVPQSWIAEMAKPSLANGQYGLHVWLGQEWTAERAYNATNPIKIKHSEPFEAKDIVYFDGFGGQRVYVIPSEGLTIVRSGLVNLEFDDSRLPNTLVRALD